MGLGNLSVGSFAAPARVRRSTAKASGGGDIGDVRRRVRGCRLVTRAVSARVLLASQLQALPAIDWTVVSGDPYPDPPSGVAARHVAMDRALAPSDLVAFVRLVRLLRAERFRFVQTHTQKASLIGLPAARLAGAVPIYTMHGSLYYRGNPWWRNLPAWVFERWCCTWATRVFLQSREDFETLPRAGICRAGKLRYIGNGIRTAEFAPVPLPSRSRPTVLMISRLVSEKGCRDFFAVAAALRGQARFVHVGPVEVDQRDAISEHERAAAVAGGVELVGEVADVRPHVAAADLMILPSYREGIPRAAMEAASMGRPVVAYDIRGVREVIPPDTGLLVARGDVGALIRRVASLVEAGPEERARLGAACARHASRFSEEAVVERLQAAYAELGLL